jgi:hypothetical protein
MTVATAFAMTVAMLVLVVVQLLRRCLELTIVLLLVAAHILRLLLVAVHVLRCLQVTMLMLVVQLLRRCRELTIVLVVQLLRRLQSTMVLSSVNIVGDLAGDWFSILVPP